MYVMFIWLEYLVHILKKGYAPFIKIGGTEYYQAQCLGDVSHSTNILTDLMLNTKYISDMSIAKCKLKNYQCRVNDYTLNLINTNDYILNNENIHSRQGPWLSPAVLVVFAFWISFCHFWRHPPRNMIAISWQPSAITTYTLSASWQLYKIHDCTTRINIHSACRLSNAKTSKFSHLFDCRNLLIV